MNFQIYLIFKSKYDLNVFHPPPNQDLVFRIRKAPELIIKFFHNKDILDPTGLFSNLFMITKKNSINCTSLINDKFVTDKNKSKHN